MIVKGIRLLTLFYAMYFLGHLSMSTVYRLGTTATTVFGSASLVAIIFTLWKAAGRSESTKECVYGIVAGFFIWCFAGEFLEHEGILEIAALKAAPVLILYTLLQHHLYSINSIYPSALDLLSVTLRWSGCCTLSLLIRQMFYNSPILNYSTSLLP